MYSQKERILFLFLTFLGISFGLIHDLKIKQDHRQQFFIENFGFNAHGRINMTILNFKVGDHPISEDEKNGVGFLVKITETDSSSLPEEMIVTNREKCISTLANPDPTTEFVIQIKSAEKTVFTKEISSTEEGLYNIFFLNCLEKSISFELKLKMYNLDSDGHINYLSSGYSPLPSLFATFTIIYAVIIFIWIYFFVYKATGQVNRIHHLMTVLLVLKFMSLFCNAAEYHYVKTTGSPEGWNIAFYIFTGLRGIMLFVLISLIGTGWAFVKPYLSDKDKKIFLLVIPLQILDNVALIIIEETAPGSQSWITWKEIFRLIDIICCGAILIPIIWSLKHLKDAAATDGKAAITVKKLKLFREFYLMVVSYIYFTRIIVFLAEATLPYKLIWLADFFTEAATLLFFCVTGWKFRPSENNPYFKLDDQDTEDIELETSQKESTKNLLDKL